MSDINHPAIGWGKALSLHPALRPLLRNGISLVLCPLKDVATFNEGPPPTPPSILYPAPLFGKELLGEEWSAVHANTSRHRATQPSPEPPHARAVIIT